MHILPVCLKGRACMSQLSVGPLVRAVTSNSITIWTEWMHPCEAILHVTASEQPAAQTPDLPIACSRTVTIGNHHYALLQLDGLQASTWYDYRITCKTGEGEQATIPVSSALK